MENNDDMLYFVIESPNIRIGKLKNKYELINSDDHKLNIVKKFKKDLNDFRPDILHLSLLTIFDSALNKKGNIIVYVKIKENTVIEINPKCKIPRTFKRFSNLLVQLIRNSAIKSSVSQIPLLRIINKPIREVLPKNILIIGTSSKAENINLENFIKKNYNLNNKKLCFVVGAVANSNIGMNVDYIDNSISISNYVLSSSSCLFKIINKFEEFWKIDL